MCFLSFKVEELRKRHKGKTFSDGVYEFSNSTRRSFLRKIKGSETSSGNTIGEDDCKELAVYSDIDSLMCPISQASSGYLRVEKRSFTCVRPILILGPFANYVIEKLTSTNPSKFVHCVPEYMNSDLRTVEKGMTDNIFIDYKRRASHFECTTMRSVMDIINNNQHAFLDVNIRAIERLQQQQIYPIVLLIKFKNAKQLKEVNLWDPRNGFSNQDQSYLKDAKNMYEHSLKMEQEYGNIISDVVHVVHANITLLTAQVSIISSS